MTIEISRGKSQYQYRISKDDPLVIQRKVNKSHSHWLNFARLSNADEAKRALLRLEDEAAGEADAEAEWQQQHILLKYTGAVQ